MGTNIFGALPLIPPGASGPQAPINLFPLAPSGTGLDRHLTFIAKGDFTEGNIAIEGSPDGMIWDVLGQFTAGSDADQNLGPRVEFSPLLEDVCIQRVRANVKAKVNGPNPTKITFGGEENCACLFPPTPPPPG